MPETWLYDAVRTPFGRIGGDLAAHRPDDLAAHLVSALIERAPTLGGPADAGVVDEVVLGNANGAGEENRNVARMAALLADMPVSVPGTTVNRLCGSSLDAAMQASRQIDLGEADLMLVGGVESMSRAPWVLPKTEKPYPAGDAQLSSTTLGWRLVNPRMPAEWTVSLGEATEQLRAKHGITRQDQDAFAARSHRLAAAAWEQGRYDELVVAVPGRRSKDAPIAADQSIRPETSVETLAELPTVFRREDPQATVTAGNASPMSDGAAAAWLGSARAAELLGRDPVARIVGRGAAAVEPQLFGEAPVPAAEIALRRAGLSWSDVGAVELNEAFAVQSLACTRQWLAAGLADPELVNAWGGALALGHPLGASGARVLGTLAARMREEGVRHGVATLCIGVGQGLAVVLENPDAG